MVEILAAVAALLMAVASIGLVALGIVEDRKSGLADIVVPNW